MTSWNGNIFRVTGHLCGEFTGPRWIPSTKASAAELWCFLDLRPNKRLSKQWWGRWFETPSCPLWRHCNEPFNTHVMCVYIQDSVGSFVTSAGPASHGDTALFGSAVYYEITPSPIAITITSTLATWHRIMTNRYLRWLKVSSSRHSGVSCLILISKEVFRLLVIPK